jgi:hypothetical protein
MIMILAFGVMCCWGVIIWLSSFLEFLVYQKIRFFCYLTWVCGMNIHGYEISENGS